MKEKKNTTIEYWNSTGEWRKKYYSEIKKRDWTTLSDIEQMEYELDCAEYFTIKMFLESKEVFRVLDIGCGVGRQLLDLASLFPGIHFDGIDIAPLQIELLDCEIKSRCLKNIKAIAMNAADIAELNVQYDMIISCNNSLGCFSEEERSNCLKSMCKVLSTDGIFVIGNFERFDIADKCYTEWGMSLVSIDYSNRVVDLGPYKSTWLSSDMLERELYTYGLNHFYRYAAGLGSVCAFQKRGSYNEKIL